MQTRIRNKQVNFLVSIIAQKGWTDFRWSKKVRVLQHVSLHSYNILNEGNNTKLTVHYVENWKREMGFRKKTWGSNNEVEMLGERKWEGGRTIRCTCCLMVASAASTAFKTWNKLLSLLLPWLLDERELDCSTGAALTPNSENFSANDLPSKPFSIFYF